MSFFVFLLFAPWIYSCHSGPDVNDRLLEMLQLHESVLTLEQRNFEKLVFELSDFQFQPTRNLKLVLDDQFGNKWLFKFGDSSRRGALAIYSLYRLLGIPTPPIFEMNLPINGRIYSGTIQKFVDNIGGLERNSYMELSSQAHSDLVINHLLAWVAANSHIHPRQFLVVPGNSSNENRVVRIDNTIEWFTVGRDALNVDYRCPSLHDVAGAGWAEFLRLYMRGLIDIDFTQARDIGLLIQSLPDEYFSSFFKVDSVEELFSMQSINIDSYNAHTLYPDLFTEPNLNFYKTLLERKSMASYEVFDFYLDISKYRDDGPSPSLLTPLRDISDIVEERINALEIELLNQRERRNSLMGSRMNQRMILAVISYEANEILKKLFLHDLFGSKENLANQALAVELELQELMNRENHPLSHLAIGQALTVPHMILNRIERQGLPTRREFRRLLQRANDVFSIHPQFDVDP